MSALKIFIADDHDLLRRGLRQILIPHPGWEICGEAATGVDAVAKIRELKPDVAILDVSMPALDGLSAAKQIRAVSPSTEILILSMHYSDQLVRDILEIGIRGFVIKSDSDRDLVNAVEALSHHEPFLTAEVTQVLLSQMPTTHESRQAKRLQERLTEREREIVRVTALGNSSIESAAILNISVKAVETHRSDVMRKLDLHSVSDLVRYAIRNGIIEP